MEARRFIAATLVAMLALPGALAWNQPAGNAQRSEPLVLAPGPIDVLGSVPLPNATSTHPFWSAGLLPTPDGIVSVIQSGETGDCALAVFDDPLGPPTRTHGLDACDYPHIVAYDEDTHSAFVCSVTSVALPVIEARDVRDGSQRWAVRAPQLDPAPGSAVAGCYGAAFDPETRELFVPTFTGATYASVSELLVSQVDNKLAILDADDGAMKALASVPSEPVPTGSPIPLGSVAAPIFEQYRGVSLTSTGVVVTGFVGTSAGMVGVRSDCPAGTCNEGVVAWFTRDGVFVGKERAASSNPQSAAAESGSQARGISKFPAAQGPSAAFLLGTEVVLLNPELVEPASRAPLEAISPNFVPFVTQSVWIDDTILVALSTGLAAVGPGLQPRWSWTDGLESYVTDVVPTASGLAIVTVETPATANISVTALDLRTGQTVLTLPMPIARGDSAQLSHESRMTPMPGGRMLFVDGAGNRVLLGAADRAELPRVSLSNEYPAPGEGVTFVISPPPGADVTHYLLFAGSGAGEKVMPGESPTLTFATRGDQDVRVLAMLADGRTRTAVATVRVGADPPPELSALDVAFSADYQNWTFFGLGLAVTIVGFAFTVGRQRHRLNRLERELAAVEEIRLLSVENPREAARNLKAYRERLPVDLAKRRIDESQFHVLDVRSARLLKVLRTRLFAPFDTRMSARYHRLMDAAFEDAILQASEKEALVIQLDQEEALSFHDKQEIAAILEDFTSYNVGLVLRT